jgi:hypothetical protein
MKFTFVVSQSGVVDAGLLGKVAVQDLCLLHYLRGWFNFGRAKIGVVEGRKFVWLHAENAIEELPLLFKPQAKLTSRKNQLSVMIEKLRVAGLVETTRIGRRLFFRLTDLAVGVTQRHKLPSPTATKPDHIVTPPHDETVTPEQDRTVMSSRDEYLPSIINETGTKESERRETPPLSPSEGEAQSILAFWNSFLELRPARTITPNRARKIRKRLADPFWREHWRAGVQRAAASQFLTGKGQQGRPATLDWFLSGDSLTKILEGHYDNRPTPDRKRLPSDVKAQLKGLDELIAELAEEPYYDGDNAAEFLRHREELSKLQRRRKELVRELAGVPHTSREPGELDD